MGAKVGKLDKTKSTPTPKKEVIVGMWKSAPFKGSFERGIDRLNDFLKENGYPTQYSMHYLDPKKVSTKELTSIDVLVFDGGEDVNPARYGERNVSSYFSDTRDAAEFQLLSLYRNARGSSGRFAGTCRGHQLLNVGFGGSLYQDIHSMNLVSSKDGHTSGHKVFVASHKQGYPHFSKNDKSMNTVLGDSFLSSNSPFTVSSLHHQAVRNLGEHLKITLYFRTLQGEKKIRHYRNCAELAHRGLLVVEGIESISGNIRGVQSHPEFNGYPKDGILFAYLMHVDKFAVKPDEEITEKMIRDKVEELRTSGKLEKAALSKYSPNRDSLAPWEEPRLYSRENHRGSRTGRTPQPSRRNNEPRRLRINTGDSSPEVSAQEAAEIEFEIRRMEEEFVEEEDE